MQAWIWEALSKRKALPLKFERIVQKYGVPTGSFVFGGFVKGESDIDIIISPKCPLSSQDITEYMVYIGNDYSDTEEYRSFYVRNSNNDVLNLLFVSNIDTFNIWRKATRLMKYTCKHKQIRKLIEQKQHRVELFEYFKTLISITEYKKLAKCKEALTEDTIPF